MMRASKTIVAALTAQFPDKTQGPKGRALHIKVVVNQMEARCSRWEPSNRVDGRSTAFFLARNPALSGGPQELAAERLSGRAGDCTGMNKRLMRIGLWLWLAAAFILRSMADVSVTEP